MYDNPIATRKPNKKFILLGAGLGILLITLIVGAIFLVPKLPFIDTLKYTHEKTIQGSWEINFLTNCGTCDDGGSSYYKFVGNTFTKYDSNKQITSTGDVTITNGQATTNIVDNNGQRLDKIIQYLAENNGSSIDDIYVVRMKPTNASEEISIWRVESNDQSQVSASVVFQTPRYGKKSFDYDKAYMNFTETASKI